MKIIKDIIKRTKTYKELESNYNKKTFRISPTRRDGNTTRCADQYIQRLFENGSIEVEDHYFSRQSHERLIKIITKRLDNEHPGVKYNVLINSLIIKL